MIRPKYESVDSTIVLVGGNSGIGIALTNLLLECGVKVIAADIQQESNTHRHQELIYYRIDPTDNESMLAFANELITENAHITGLVCLSGTILNFKTIEDLDFEDWTKEFNISFKSCYNACKYLMPLLKRAPNAAIVNMSSGLAFGGQAKYGAYSNAKASIVSLSKILATELGPSIRVNSIAPGAVDTPFIYTDGAKRFDEKMYEQISPLSTIAKPEDIAQTILFLLSEGADHITGQCIHVNGGTFMV